MRFLKDELESLPFLSGQGEGGGSPKQDDQTTRKRTSIIWKLYVVQLHVFAVVLLWKVVSTTSTNKAAVCETSSIGALTWSPAQHKIEYEPSSVLAIHGKYYSQFGGPPSDEQDEAWDNLMRPVYFNASTEELRQAGETITEDIAELEEGGYLANIAVYHELHCLRQLRFWLYRDRYYPNLTEVEDVYQHEHLDHCLEALRLRVQCDANTALYTFYWEESTDIRPVVKSRSSSMCAKWDTLEDWATSRMVPTAPIFKNPPIKTQ